MHNIKKTVGYSIHKETIVKRTINSFYKNANIIVGNIKINEKDFYVKISAVGLSIKAMNDINQLNFYIKKHLSLIYYYKKPVLFLIDVKKLENKEPHQKKSKEIIQTIINDISYSKFFLIFLKRELEKTNRHNRIIDNISQIIDFSFNEKQNKNCIGIKLQIKGRINNADRSKKMVVKFGKVPGNTVKISKKQFVASVFTPSGVLGLKLTIFTYDK